MAPQRATWAWPLFALGTLFLALANAQGPSIPIAFCASINTSPNAANLSNFQTEGLCAGFCRADWALAVVLDKSCWCTNNVPDSGSQTDSGKCNSPCPGFPSDLCGGDNLFGYLALDKSPSGTSGGSPQSTSDSVKTSGTKPVQSTTSDPSTSPSSSSISTTTSSSSTTTQGPAPSPSVQTVTAGGTVKTVTITPTNTATDSPNSANISATSGGLATGAVVGIAVGVIGVVGILVGILVWMWCRRRNRNTENGAFDPSSQRASSSGMTSTPKTGGVASEGHYGMGPEMGENWDPNTQNGRRRSTLMPVDPRLDPYARGIYAAQNKSRESVSSLQDNQDYSRRVRDAPRVLRTTNPDPEGD